MKDLLVNRWILLTIAGVMLLGGGIQVDNPGGMARGIPDILKREASSGIRELEDEAIYLPLIAGLSQTIPMVYVPAGVFPMGCDPDHNGGYECPEDETPLHTVYLDAFYIDKYEVTNSLYALCVAAEVCTGGDFNSPAKYPVVFVTWNEAAAYCTWVGKRLPTEAEWEKAARGTTLRAFPWGDQSPDCTLANFVYPDGEDWEYCVGSATEVGSYPLGASPYGAMDMAGNVLEWVNDWYQADYYSTLPDSNPTGPDTGTSKVMRGGSWNPYWNYQGGANLRVADRDAPFFGVNLGDNAIGFRCVFPAGQ